MTIGLQNWRNKRWNEKRYQDRGVLSSGPRALISTPLSRTVYILRQKKPLHIEQFCSQNLNIFLKVFWLNYGMVEVVLDSWCDGGMTSCCRYSQPSTLMPVSCMYVIRIHESNEHAPSCFRGLPMMISLSSVHNNGSHLSCWLYDLCDLWLF